jgi:hypothetical protein
MRVKNTKDKTRQRAPADTGDDRIRSWCPNWVRGSVSFYEGLPQLCGFNSQEIPRPGQIIYKATTTSQLLAEALGVTRQASCGSRIIFIFGRTLLSRRLLCALFLSVAGGKNFPEKDSGASVSEVSFWIRNRTSSPDDCAGPLRLPLSGCLSGETLVASWRVTQQFR